MIGVMALGRIAGKLARPVWYVLAAGAALLLLWRWHGGRVTAAYGAGVQAQAAADRVRFEQAAAASAKAQEAVKAALMVRQGQVTKGTGDALFAKNADLARRYDDLRLRWAAYRAGGGDAGEGGAIAVSGTADGIVDAACPAAGWVSFDTAAAAAEAADTAIARDDAWREWVAGQRAAWPE